MRVTPHVQLRTSHREDLYIIDIVTREHFQQFFNELDRFHQELVAAIRTLKFAPDFRAAVRAKLKEEPSPDIKAIVSMAVEESRQKRRELRRSAREAEVPRGNHESQ